MRRRLGILALLVVAALFALLPCLATLAHADRSEPVPAPKLAAVDDDITGYYAVSGKTPAGKPYDGILLLERAGDTYLVQWSVGGSTTLGVGTRQGDLFCVGWRLGEQIGVNVYRIAGRTFSGTYQTIPGNGRRHPERLTWLRGLPQVEKDAEP